MIDVRSRTRTRGTNGFPLPILCNYPGNPRKCGSLSCASEPWLHPLQDLRTATSFTGRAA